MLEDLSVTCLSVILGENTKYKHYVSDIKGKKSQKKDLKGIYQNVNSGCSSWFNLGGFIFFFMFLKCLIFLEYIAFTLGKKDYF